MNRFTTNGGDSVQTLAQWQTSTGQDQHSLVATPSQLFVNPAGGDYPPLRHEPGGRCRHVAVRPGGRFRRHRPPQRQRRRYRRRRARRRHATASSAAPTNQRRPTSLLSDAASKRTAPPGPSSARCRPSIPTRATRTRSPWSITPAADSRISGNQLVVDSGSLLNYEAATSHTIVVRATDGGGLSVDKIDRGQRAERQRAGQLRRAARHAAAVVRSLSRSGLRKRRRPQPT